MAATRLYLFRHGEALKNTDPDIVGGRSNSSPLTSLGWAHGRQIVYRLAGRRESIAAAYCSPAVRTRQPGQSALWAAGIELPLIEKKGLQELSQGEWEGHNRHEPRPRADGTWETYPPLASR